MRNVCGLNVHKENFFVCIDKENGEVCAGFSLSILSLIVKDFSLD